MDAEKVMRFVRRALEKDPDQASAGLFEKAKEIDRGVKELSLRQFHARFPLQVKRREAMEKKEAGNGRSARPQPRASRSRTASSRKVESSRGAVREAFLRFATDLSAASERSELVGVLARVDEYVNEVMGAVEGSRRKRR